MLVLRFRSWQTEIWKPWREMWVTSVALQILQTNIFHRTLGRPRRIMRCQDFELFDLRTLYKEQGPGRAPFETVRSLRCWSRGIETEGDLRKNGRDREVQRRAHLERKDGSKASGTRKIRAGTGSSCQKITVATTVRQTGGVLTFFNLKSVAAKVASLNLDGANLCTY